MDNQRPTFPLPRFGPPINARTEDLILAFNGGVGPFSVLWEWEFITNTYRPIRQQNGIPGNNGLEDIDGLPPGDYRVTVTDAACGQYIQELELLQGLFDTGGRRIVVSKGNVKTCGKEGTNDGYIELEYVMGLSEPYDIVWNGPGVNNVMGRSIRNLQDGIYTVTITTPDGCELVKKITICCCEVPTIDNLKHPEKLDKDPIACSNRDLVFPITIYQDLLYSPDNRNSYNGQIQIRISGGTSENTILWTGPDGFTSDRTSIGNLGVGKYCVTVQDGCSEDSRCYELVDCS